MGRENEWVFPETPEEKCPKLKEENAALRAEVEQLKIQLAAADNGLLRASDPKSGWQGISKECKLWQERAEKAESDLAAAVEVLQKIAERGQTLPEDSMWYRTLARAFLTRIEPQSTNQKETSK